MLQRFSFVVFHNPHVSITCFLYSYYNVTAGERNKNHEDVESSKHRCVAAIARYVFRLAYKSLLMYMVLFALWYYEIWALWTIFGTVIWHIGKMASSRHHREVTALFAGSPDYVTYFSGGPGRDGVVFMGVGCNSRPDQFHSWTLHKATKPGFSFLMFILCCVVFRFIDACLLLLCWV